MLKPIRKTANGTEYWDTEAKKVVIGGSDMTFHKEEKQPLGVSDGENHYELTKMTVKELKELATQKDIDIPAEITKKDSIAQFIFDNWVTDAE